MGGIRFRGVPSGSSPNSNQNENEIRFRNRNAYSDWGPERFDEPDHSESSMSDDAKRVREIFREISDYENWIKSVLDSDASDGGDTIEAFRDWARGEFMDGRHYKKEFKDLDSYSKSTLSKIYKHLDKFKLNRGIVTYRKAGFEMLGASRMTLSQVQAMEGSVVRVKGAMSTSAAAKGLDIGTSKPVEYEFHFPKGTVGGGAYIGDRRINPGWGAGQREFLTNKNTYYRIGKSRQEDGIIKVQVYYVGKDD